MRDPDVVAAAAKYVAAFEGFRPYAYPDPASPLGVKLGSKGRDKIGYGGQIPPGLQALSGDPWTVGFGQTGKGVEYGMQPWTEQHALAELAFECAARWKAIKGMAQVPLTANQAVALTSLSFNIGIDALRKSTLMARLNAGDYAGAADQFDRWVFANGQRLNGLVTRRAAEKVLFRT